jgi:hypothetical protein
MKTIDSLKELNKLTEKEISDYVESDVFESLRGRLDLISEITKIYGYCLGDKDILKNINIEKTENIKFTKTEKDKILIYSHLLVSSPNYSVIKSLIDESR